ncbi:ribosome maturation factor RimP [Clostridium polyendosporum]|uniref:Ribosome maturation factor RimP n=1 Tax=Clostridium polyendosporum TaxID=69208 RepID=A0A919RWX5_9CLOT|nr:ribosome maturation factor RimP [Clostridium polyendosporum]GIM27804.1 ribosome maturation factor RimP [Clostridium polyendosporum]
MKKELLVEKVAELVKPIVDSLSYELYYVEYVKENNEYFLRIYIDKPEGISLQDCEKVSRQVSDMLDVEDPIKDPYYLEVSSPGLNRPLFTEEHYNRFIGSEVLVRFTKSISGKKNVKGILAEATEETLIVENDDGKFTVPKDKIKAVNLEGEI